MKNFTKIALAVALIGGVSATALSIDSASARGWNNNGAEQGQQFKGRHGGDRNAARGPRGGDMLKVLDANKDGTLTKDELTSGLTKKISDNDTDGDGAVSLEEFKAEWAKMTQDRMVRAYQKMDRDGDGKVTLEEISEPASAMFDRMDRNDDGKLDKTDRPERQARGERGGKRGPHNGGPNGQRGGKFQPSNFAPTNAGPETSGPRFDGPAPQGSQSVDASHSHDGSGAPHQRPISPLAQLR